MFWKCPRVHEQCIRRSADWSPPCTWFHSWLGTRDAPPAGTIFAWQWNLYRWTIPFVLSAWTNRRAPRTIRLATWEGCAWFWFVWWFAETIVSIRFSGKSYSTRRPPRRHCGSTVCCISLGRGGRVEVWSTWFDFGGGVLTIDIRRFRCKGRSFYQTVGCKSFRCCSQRSTGLTTRPCPSHL